MNEEEAPTRDREQHWSRRQFLETTAATGLSVAAGTTFALGQTREAPVVVPELILTNGRIHTMDARNTIASVVVIAGRRFVAVGNRAPARGPGTRVVDLRGRTVIPGIIDAHNHLWLPQTPYALRRLRLRPLSPGLDSWRPEQSTPEL